MTEIKKGIKGLNWYLQQAKEQGWAVAHFNFASAEQLRAIVQGFQNVEMDARRQDKELALMVGTSEGEGGFLGPLQARALTDAWKKETGLPIFLNADHHKSFETCKEKIDAGYDTVLIDASKLSLQENIAVTKKIIEYAKNISANRQTEITVEGELGYLRGESKVQEKIEISPEDFTKPEEAEEFVKETGVDRLAIAIGNIHGIATKQKMEINFDLIKKIAESVPETHLVLHGGSGLTNDDFKKSIECGITNVHINTEVRVAYRKGIEERLKEAPDEAAPYKFLDKAVEEMQKVVEDKIRVFTF